MASLRRTYGGPMLTRRGFMSLMAGMTAALALAGIRPREAEAFDPGTVTVSHTGGNDDSPWYHYPTTWDATKNYGTAENPLYCVNPNLKGPATLATYQKEDVSRYLQLHPHDGAGVWEHDRIRACAWYSWLAPGFDASIYPATDWNGDPMSPASYFVACHVLLTDVITSNGILATSGGSQGFIDWVKDNILGYTELWLGGPVHENTLEVKAAGNYLGTLPDRSVFDVFILNPENAGNAQCLLGWDYHPKGYGRLHKDVAKTW